MINRFIKACLDLPFLVIIATVIAAVIGGLALRDNPKDAIPDISENQTIVSCDWMGRSPEDVEDQVTYPLSVAMQGIPQVKDVRTISGFGFSRIYVVFEDGVDIYWARSRVVERLAVASANLPEGVVPVLGPDATSLGQIYWYTIEGPQNLADLRSIQDFVVKFALQNVDGVAEVASIGGFVREYQIEVDPERLRAHNVAIDDLVKAVKVCAPIDYNPGRRTKDKLPLYYFVCFEEDNSNYALGLSANQIVNMELTKERFNPAEFDSYGANWFLARDKGPVKRTIRCLKQSIPSEL